MDWELLDWQTAISLLIVAAAVGILIRKTWSAFAGKDAGGCGTSCANCPSMKGTEPESLVQLQASRQ